MCLFTCISLLSLITCPFDGYILRQISIGYFHLVVLNGLLFVSWCVFFIFRMQPECWWALGIRWYYFWLVLFYLFFCGFFCIPFCFIVVILIWLRCLLDWYIILDGLYFPLEFSSIMQYGFAVFLFLFFGVYFFRAEMPCWGRFFGKCVGVGAVFDAVLQFSFAVCLYVYSENILWCGHSGILITLCIYLLECACVILGEIGVI